MVRKPHRQARAPYHDLVTISRETMTSHQEQTGGFWQKAKILLGLGPGTGPVDSVAALENFVSTRAAFVAQKTLYGYVKTRMGIRYVAMFADANVIASVNIAKMQVFAACLSDLTIYGVAQALHDQPIGNDERQTLALRIFQTGLRDNAGEAPAQFSAEDAIEAFKQRLTNTDWVKRALQPENFTESPRALLRWAPIADNLKKFDSEIVENSVKFAWRDIREQFNKRLDAAAVAADWTHQPS
jgi:hypothetical protein